MTTTERRRMLDKAREHFRDKGHDRKQARKLARILVNDFERQRKAGLITA